MKILCVKGCKLVDDKGRPKACGHTLSVRFWYKTKEIKRSMGTRNLREAEKRGHAELEKVEQEAYLREHHPERVNDKPSQPVPSFQEFAEPPEGHFDGGQWWWKFATNHYQSKPKSLAFYRSRINVFLGYKPIASCRLDQIDRSVIDDFIAARLKVGRSPSTVNQDVEVLEYVLRKARTWKLITELPEFPHGSEKLPVQHVGRAIKPEEEKIYFAALDEAGYRDMSDLARLSVETSMEPGDVLLGLLDWKHVQFDNLGEGYEHGMIHDPFTKRESRKRNLPMSPALAQTMRERWLRMGRPAEGLVFEHPEHKGRPIAHNTLVGQHNRLWEKGWITIEYFRPYDLRHTMLTRLYEAGGDRSDVQAFAGWASPHSSIAGVYLHENRERLGRARKVMDAYVEKLRARN